MTASTITYPAAALATMRAAAATVPESIRANVLFDLLALELDADLRNALTEIRGVYHWRDRDADNFFYHADKLCRVAKAIFNEAEDAT